MNNVSVRLVFDRKHVATKKHQASVQIEVTFQKKRKFISTGIKLYADQWGKDFAVKNHPQSIQLNQELNRQISGIYDYQQKLFAKNIKFSLERLESFLRGTNASEKDSFLNFMEQRIYSRHVAEGTQKRQLCVLRALYEFGKIRDFEDISLKTIKEYDDFAWKKCACQASVYNYHKILKTFVREAYAFEYIPFNPYISFKLKKGEATHRKFLMREELEKLEEATIENPSLQQVRDVFLFCCFTGLAYSDLVLFDFSKTVFSNGMYRVRDYRVKTGTEFNISLIDKSMEILKKYKFHLPVISNQKYNSYLKILGAYCDINKRLTSHVARHTFATTIALANGVRIEVISKMLGHTNIKTTQIYAKISQQEVDSEFNRINTIV